MCKAIQSERVGDGVRKRYIRAHATLAGTAGSSPKVCVAFLLGKPISSGYIVNASTQATGNVEFKIGY